MQLCLTSPLLVKPASLVSRCRCQDERPSRVLPVASPLPKRSQICRLSTFCSERLNSSSLAALLLPVAAACAVLTACPVPVEAGIFSGSSGIESLDLPSIPEPGFLKKIQEQNKKKYADFDAKFKSSPYLQGLLKKSRENADLIVRAPVRGLILSISEGMQIVQEIVRFWHRKEIEDKYCERGAEWGVGDCSLNGLPQADKDAFLEALRKGKTK